MKLFLVGLALVFSTLALAHEGHGEMPTELSKFGGILGNVVSETKMESKAKHNPPLMKAEIVRSEDGTIRVYLYDLKMKQLKAQELAKEAKGVVDNRKAKTKDKFTLMAHGDHFMGKIPKQKKRPFDIYVSFTKGTDKYFVAFDNLD